MVANYTLKPRSSSAHFADSAPNRAGRPETQQTRCRQLSECHRVPQAEGDPWWLRRRHV